MNLGETIYRLRTQRNMSQEDLAATLGVSRQSISKWENNNAVPELDKLIKLSEIFEISLDNLVGKEMPPPKHSHASLFSQIPTRKIVGTVLLACAFMVFCISLAAGSIRLFCIPFALCAVACFVFQRHTGVWCAWALYLPLALFPIRQYVRIDIAIYTTLFVQIPLLIYTILDYRKEPLSFSRRDYILLGLGYLLFAVCCYDIIAENFIRPFHFWEGRNLSYWLEYIAFPLFNLLATVTLRLLRTGKPSKF